MKHCLCILFMAGSLLVGCHHSKKADLPNPDELYSSIRFLDSLTHSVEVDSISRIHDKLTTCLATYASQAQSPDDKAVLDSLDKIHTAAADYLRYCTDTKANLELLNQDTKTVVSRFWAGQIKVAAYANSLLQDEEVVLGIQEDFISRRKTVLRYLKNQSELVRLLTPLPLPQNP